LATLVNFLSVGGYNEHTIPPTISFRGHQHNLTLLYKTGELWCWLKRWQRL